MSTGSIKSEQLLPLVYAELRKMAGKRLSLESANHTLQPTELVHEAWLRTVGAEDRTWENRSSFFSAAALAMRRILVEHARKKSRQKRGGNPVRVDVDVQEFSTPQPDDKILMVDAALQQLEAVDPQRAKIVELKYFAGLKNREIAEMLNMGERTVARHWLCARTWLLKQMQNSA
ncbi:MAG: sigma-70 family RNA polymerase sigma factor [Pontiellaceae bacterium]|nr:sigma-70 family RNA polymerase sigma factor [Pontiellaceae bacterium]